MISTQALVLRSDVFDDGPCRGPHPGGCPFHSPFCDHLTGECVWPTCARVKRFSEREPATPTCPAHQEAIWVREGRRPGHCPRLPRSQLLDVGVDHGGMMGEMP